eukprot:TRINITY_DN113439_c0_g1_i1.p1 TRINITY_DN113439_c0_g1~~TRINITY_DN113439_c0_g1_i1.p1  ORF type:complete len:449 (-),score=114.13 TRINITY_DN113439_c0_g1_i1:176-1522(-)
MVASAMMLPLKAVQHEASEEEMLQATPDATPENYGRHSPMSRWLGLPCASQGLAGTQQPVPQATSIMQDSSAVAPQMQPFVPQMAGNSFPQPAAWVYVVPVAAVPAVQQPQASGNFVWPTPDGMLVGKSGSDFNVVANCDSSDAGSNELPSRLSASAARRRRRQRAAAYAKAEQLQRNLGEATGQPVLTTATTKANASPPCGLTNELCQQLKQKLQAGGEAMQLALTTMRGCVRAFTFDSAGCRVVQTALEYASPAEAADLVQELKGSIRKAATNPYGNYVIQKAIETLPWTTTHFMVEELLHHGSQTARHQYGCRIMCRLLEHSLLDPDTVRLFEEVLLNVGALCRHEFAHYVMESMLEHGLEAHKNAVARSLEQELAYSNVNRSMMYVLEAACRNCSPDMAKRLMAAKQQYVSNYFPSLERSHCVSYEGAQYGLPPPQSMQPVFVH